MKILVGSVCFISILLLQNCIQDEIEILEPMDVDQMHQFPGGVQEMYNKVYY